MHIFGTLNEAIRYNLLTTVTLWYSIKILGRYSGKGKKLQKVFNTQFTYLKYSKISKIIYKRILSGAFQPRITHIVLKCINTILNFSINFLFIIFEFLWIHSTSVYFLKNVLLNYPRYAGK